MKVGLIFAGSDRNIKTDLAFKNEVNELKLLVEKNKNATEREKKHVDALLKWSSKDYDSALLTYETILVDHPTDTHALKNIQDFCFSLGKKAQMKDTIARALPHYQNSNPLKSYVHGMMGFAFEENGLYDYAIKEAENSLKMNPYDGWAHHAIGHVYEMLGKTELGLKHYEKRKSDWLKADWLISHNYWHYGVYHIEEGLFEEAFQVFNNNVLPICMANNNVFNIHDSASFLYRLKLADEKNSRLDSWSNLHTKIQPHLNDHVLGFNDAHYIMSCLSTKNYKEAESFIETLDKEDSVYDITNTLLNAMLFYEKGNYSKAVDLLYPIKYDILKIGGSDAQRDVFHQLFVMASIKSENPFHKKLAKQLISERDQLKDKSFLNSLMAEKLKN